MSGLQDRKTYVKFILLYCFIYMCTAIYSTFIPVYLSSIGYSNTNVGLLLSISPIVAMAGHPFWGRVSDRARYKNSVLLLLIASCSVLAQTFLLSTNFFFLMGVIFLFTFFSASVAPVADAITLEHTRTTGWSYGRIRMAGTIGFAVMAIVAGIITKTNTGMIFPLYFAIGMAAMVTTHLLPKQCQQVKKSSAQYYNIVTNIEIT